MYPLVGWITPSKVYKVLIYGTCKCYLICKSGLCKCDYINERSKK